METVVEAPQMGRKIEAATMDSPTGTGSIADHSKVDRWCGQGGSLTRSRFIAALVKVDR